MSFDYRTMSYGFLVSDTNLDPNSDPAGVDHLYKVVALSGTGESEITPVTAIGDVAFGILANYPVEGEAAEVVIGGVAKVVAGGAVTANSPVYLLADGTVADSSAVGARFIGTALADGVTGDVVPVHLAELNSATSLQV